MMPGAASIRCWSNYKAHSALKVHSHILTIMVGLLTGFVFGLFLAAAMPVRTTGLLVFSSEIATVCVVHGQQAGSLGIPIP